jgi:hypothetical protein
MTGRRTTALLVLLAAPAALVGGGVAGPAQACHVAGSGELTRPDDRCTPGTFDDISRAAVCEHKERPPLPAAEKTRIVRQYGFQRWSGRDGELDHRVPFFLGGRTEEDNLWPQRGRIPNAKDRVERDVYERVCVDGTTTVDAARRVFMGDWVPEQ